MYIGNVWRLVGMKLKIHVNVCVCVNMKPERFGIILFVSFYSHFCLHFILRNYVCIYVCTWVSTLLFPQRYFSIFLFGVHSLGFVWTLVQCTRIPKHAFVNARRYTHIQIHINYMFSWFLMKSDDSPSHVLWAQSTHQTSESSSFV